MKVLSAVDQVLAEAVPIVGTNPSRVAEATTQDPANEPPPRLEPLARLGRIDDREARIGTGPSALLQLLVHKTSSGCCAGGKARTLTERLSCCSKKVNSSGRIYRLMSCAHLFGSSKARRIRSCPACFSSRLREDFLRRAAMNSSHSR